MKDQHNRSRCSTWARRLEVTWSAGGKLHSDSAGTPKEVNARLMYMSITWLYPNQPGTDQLIGRYAFKMPPLSLNFYWDGDPHLLKLQANFWTSTKHLGRSRFSRCPYVFSETKLYKKDCCCWLHFRNSILKTKMSGIKTSSKIGGVSQICNLWVWDGI